MGTSDAELEYQLLGEVLDALDRLCDGESSAVDAAAVLFVVGRALEQEALGASVLAVAAELRRAMSERSPDRLSAEEALQVTDEIRGAVADRWAEGDARLSQ